MKNSTVNLKIDSHFKSKNFGKNNPLNFFTAASFGSARRQQLYFNSYVSSFSILACWHSRSAAAAAVAGQLNFNPAAGAAGLSAAQLQQMIQPTSYITG